MFIRDYVTVFCLAFLLSSDVWSEEVEPIRSAVNSVAFGNISLAPSRYFSYDRFSKYLVVDKRSQATSFSDLEFKVTAVDTDCIFAQYDCAEREKSDRAPQDLLIPFDIASPPIASLKAGTLDYKFNFEFYIPSESARGEVHTAQLLRLQSGGGKNLVIAYINTDTNKFRREAPTGLLFADLTNDKNEINNWTDWRPHINALGVEDVFDQWHAMSIEIRWSDGDSGYIRVYVNDRLVSNYQGPTLHAEALDEMSAKKFRPNFALGWKRSDLNRTRILKGLSDPGSELYGCVKRVGEKTSTDIDRFSKSLSRAGQGKLRKKFQERVLSSKCVDAVQRVILDSKPTIKFRKVRIESEAFEKKVRQFAGAVKPYAIAGSDVFSLLNPLSHKNTYGFSLTAETKRLGSVAQRFELRHGDCGNYTDANGHNDCRSDRTRVWAETDHHQDMLNKVGWYGFSILLPSEYIDIDPAGVGLAEVMMVGWEGTPWRIEIKDGDLILKSVTSDQNCSVTLGTIDSLKGRWLDFAVGADYGVATASGSGYFDGSYIQLFLNGERQYCFFDKPIITKPMVDWGLKDLGFKWGFYRSYVSRWLYKNRKITPSEVEPFVDESIGSGLTVTSPASEPFKYNWGIELPRGIVYFDEVRIGSSRDGVDPFLLGETASVVD